MVYDFRCRDCSFEQDTLVNESYPCPHCNGVMKRKYSSVQIGKITFQPHYNHSVGSWVTSWSDFREKLKVGSDTQSERLGLDHNYQPIHPADLRSQQSPIDIRERNAV